MILDCFIFYRELDLLEGRLEYLYDSVDYFVIVEADITHAGNKKELNFLKNMSRYRKYLDKIIYQPIHINTEPFRDSLNVDKSSPDSYSWKIENAHRSHIDNVIRLFPDEAIVLLSDLDEIPLKSSIEKGKELVNTYSGFTLFQKLCFYNFNQYCSMAWHGTVVAKNSFAKSQGVQWLRNMRYDMPKVFDGGYHLSYWGTAEDIKIKLENFAHQDINSPTATDINRIQANMNKGLDPFNRVDMIKSQPGDIDPELYNIFSKYIKTNKKTYIQIGAGAGDLDPRANYRDGFSEYVKSLNKNDIEKIILVEPNPANIAKLRESWKDYDQAIILNCGVCSGNTESGIAKFYYTAEDAPHFHVFSLSKDHVLKHYPTADILSCDVEFMNFKSFCEKFIKGNNVELLALDIEGEEANIILETDWKSLNVKTLSFEAIHLNDQKFGVFGKLTKEGYLQAGLGLDHNGYDVLYKKVDQI